MVVVTIAIEESGSISIGVIGELNVNSLRLVRSGLTKLIAESINPEIENLLSNKEKEEDKQEM